MMLELRTCTKKNSTENNYFVVVDFVVSLTVYKKVLGITSKLSDVLQKESLDYGSAASLIQASIETFESMRSDGQWDLLWQESVA